MNLKLLLAVMVMPAVPHFTWAADGQWVLQQSTLTYHVSHPLHQTEGVSHFARGKGVCHAGECDFLIAVPVKSFDSGDSNRDLHMLQATRGAEFPLVTVRTRLPKNTVALATNADLEIQFAGQTATYKQVELQVARKGKDFRISGTIPDTLKDFKIDPLLKSVISAHGASWCRIRKFLCAALPHAAGQTHHDDDPEPEASDWPPGVGYARKVG